MNLALCFERRFLFADGRLTSSMSLDLTEQYARTGRTDSTVELAGTWYRRADSLDCLINSDLYLASNQRNSLPPSSMFRTIDITSLGSVASASWYHQGSSDLPRRQKKTRPESHPRAPAVLPSCDQAYNVLIICRLLLQSAWTNPSTFASRPSTCCRHRQSGHGHEPSLTGRQIKRDG